MQNRLMKRDNKRFYFLMALPSLILTVAIFIFPLLSVILRSLKESEGLVSVIKDSYTWQLVLFSFEEAFLSALLSIVISLPFALFFSRYTFCGRRAILVISDLAFALPSIIVVLGFVIWYGNNGILNKILFFITGGRVKLHILYRFGAIILAHVYLNFPFSFSLLTQALVSSGDEEEKAARTLGKSKCKTFFLITLKKIRGTILSTFTLIFILCFSSFLIVMTLGGKTEYYTLEAEIYRRANLEASLSSSFSLSLFSFILMTIILVITGYGKKKEKITRNRMIQERVRGKKRLEAIVLSLLILSFMLPPLLSILYRAFFTRDGTFTLSVWKELLSMSNRGTLSGVNSIILSILVGLVSSFLTINMATSLSVSSVRRNSSSLALISSLPVALGSVTLGITLRYLASILSLKSNIISFLIIILAHTTVIMPFAIKTIMPGAESLSNRLLYSSLFLGRSKLYSYLFVEKRALKGYRRKAFAFSFALSMGETNATLGLGMGKFTTLPVLIYKMISQYNYQMASALALILLLICSIVFTFQEVGGNKNGLS